ncbi:HNH endonuclease [Acetobacter sacchari]|uniref:HNH endonuclease n=1 Tax=Acetobacter sacchari TaxID=2661687 RepID=A0ABS3LRE4_9PROT|nr:HNH endonuclease [Acetobacter sacchari]MBO1358478.1 HNH endonuclease [Acetobacter sacchari]
MPNCALCNTNIDRSNDSAEHIIPNAIGGSRKIRGFLCAPCNNTSGHKWDAELAAQLNGLCHLFDIRRERGELPMLTIRTTAGEVMQKLRDGRLQLPQPKVSLSETDRGFKYNVTARNASEAMKILRGIKKKHPQLNIDEEMSKSTRQTTYLQGLVELPIQIGGALAGRSIVKSAVAFALDCGISFEFCNLAINYMRNDEGEACFGYCATTDILVDRPTSKPLHCVAISGNPDTGLLIGYVEYFGFLRSVVLLSESYTGAECNRSYAIDPTTREQLEIMTRFDFSRSDMEDIFEYKHCDFEHLKTAADSVIAPALTRLRERETQHAIEDAIDIALTDCGVKRGERLSLEQSRKIADSIARRVVDFYMHSNRLR